MPNWDDMFASTVPLADIVIRATLVYLGLVAMMRVAGQRESGGLTVTDLLVVVLVGEAVAHSMATDFLSIPEGLIFAATMLAWSVVVDALAYRFPALGRILKARPRPLVENGSINQRALRREFLSRDELDAQLRLHGVHDVAEVERAYLEPNGMVSVFKREGGEDEPAPEPPAAL